MPRLRWTGTIGRPCTRTAKVCDRVIEILGRNIQPEIGNQFVEDDCLFAHRLVQERKMMVPPHVARLLLLRQYRYGDTTLSVFGLTTDGAHSP